MNPPFSNERLRNIATEFENDQKEKYIAYFVGVIQTQIIEAAVANSCGQRGGAEHNGYIGMYTFKQTIPKYVNHGKIVNGLFANYLPHILERLAVIFPEMRIQADPLQTYILFDWS